MAVVHTCSLKSTWRLRFQLESLNILLCLECFNGCMWRQRQALGPNIKQYPWGSLRMSRGSNSHFVGPKPMDFQAFFGLSRILLCVVPLPLWYLALSMATLHLLRLLKTWKLVKLSIVWALDKAFQLQASSSSQLKLHCKWGLTHLGYGLEICLHYFGNEFYRASIRNLRDHLGGWLRMWKQ